MGRRSRAKLRDSYQRNCRRTRGSPKRLIQKDRYLLFKWHENFKLDRVDALEKPRTLLASSVGNLFKNACVRSLNNH